MVTIQSQNFGVEIEMTGVSRGTAASVIANYFGVGGIHFAGGTYQTYEAKDSKGRVWKCMRDGSITPRRRRGGAIVEADDTYRCEVVTPILQYEDITDLQEVIRALVKKGADYDGRLELVQLPDKLDEAHEMDATNWFLNHHYLKSYNSPYDCTGQEFTNWFYLFRRRGHWFAYHSVSRDV